MKVFVCVTVSASLLIGLTARAQAPSAAAEVQALDEIVIVGSRSGARRSLESASPVDVVPGEDLRQRGFTDLSQVLQFLSPSFNFPPVATSVTTAGSRPATLRGMGADQVLVLVNGKRRHAATTIVTNNGVGRGTVPVDFNTLPVAAIERVEVLRDGAAAQYGSDAIAGVINIVLRDDAGGGYLGAQYGGATRGEGALIVAEGRQGVSLGEDGALTFSGDVRSHDRTNAAGIDPRFGRVTQVLGAPDTLDVTAAVNGKYQLGFGELYGFATFNKRRTDSSPLFRVPSTAPSFYPNGFLPIVRQTSHDVGAAVGLRRELAGWSFDLSNTFGYNRADFRLRDSVNTSLGAVSPTIFDSGGTRYLQDVANLTVDRRFDLLAGFNLAFGTEYRHEGYAIRRGDPASYAGAGAQGFPGINPPRPIDVARDSYSAFVDGEISLTDELRVSAAGRYERYSDFGDNTDGKLSAFWHPWEAVAFRSTISTGFRAPSLQQQFYSTVTSQLLIPSNVLANVGNFAVTDPVSRALGASPLRPESSTSYSAGLVLTPAPGLSFTADLFRIDISDRIAFSENLTGNQVLAILAANSITNVAAVRFFTNALDTRTEGFELSGRWSGVVGAGRLGLALGYARMDTDLTALRTNPVLPAVPLLAFTSIAVITDGQPGNKITANATYDVGRLHFTADAVRFGSYMFPPLGVAQTFGAQTTLDATIGFDLIPSKLTLKLGVINAFDVLPDEVIGANDGRLYAESSGGLGFEGRQVFGKLIATF